MFFSTRVFARALLLVSLCFSLIPAAFAQDSLEQKLAAVEKAIDAKRQELNIPGISLVIVKDDKVIYLKGLGERDVEKKLPVTPETLFAIGSSSKAFTSLTVLMSADEGKLSLEDNPKKHLPYFKLRDAEADSKITIADLLSHRSGLARTDLAWYTGRLKTNEVIQVAANAKPMAKLGEKFQYQNVMYLAAGEIVGKVNQTSWPAYVERRIFTPLGMKSSNLSIVKMQKAADYALGYAYDGAQKKHLRLPMRELTSISPAGAINSNARDMAQWVRLMLNGGMHNGKRIVSEKSFAELTKKRITIAGPVGYGLGWMLPTWKGHHIAEHGGNIDGFNAQVALMPDQKLGFALLTNVSASPLGSFAMKTIWEELVGPKDTTPAATLAAGSPAVAPEKESGTYVITEANVKMELAFKDGKLILTVPGQPPYPLENIGGRRYKFGTPAPAGFYATFRPKSGDAGKTEMFLEQPHGNIVLPREESAPFSAAISVEELMKKTVDALGGEVNLRKHRALLLKFHASYEEQGLTGKGEIRHHAPNKLVEIETLFAVGKKIASARDYCDGKVAGVELSFASAGPKSGPGLTDSLIAADFYAPLNWKTLFKSLNIIGEGKVGEEEVFILEKSPDKGSRLKEYISKKSFLVVKREGPGPISETLSDYREVDGVKIPFKRIRSNPMTGEGILTIMEARFDVKIPDSAFAPPNVPRKAPPAPIFAQIDPFE